MRTHTNNYKFAINGIRKFTTILKNMDTNTTISNDNLVRIKPILNGELLKSTMKQLDIESKIDIPKNTTLNFKLDVLVNNTHEYMNYGNYIVYNSEYQADTQTYLITCYDKMLVAMTDYKKPKGKNLINIQDLFSSTTDIEIVNTNKCVATATNPPAYNFKRANITNLLEVGKTYTLSYVTDNSTLGSISIDEYLGETRTRTSQTTIDILDGYTYYLKIYTNNTSSAYSGDVSITYENIQLELGTTPTGFSTYFKYPTYVRKYLLTICQDLGLVFKSLSTNFVNYDKTIQSELYLDSDGNSLGYTYRDVLDELSQATASSICISEDNKLEVRYPTETNETIDENFLKNINVTFGEKFGPVNSVVLARSGDSDTIYRKNDASILQNGLCEIKISDNQILNGINRDTFIDNIYNQLLGLNYFINDFDSPGITYLEFLDKYNVQIGNDTYGCIMLNDETDIAKGISERIYTDKLEVGETDYTKSDKADLKLNKAYLIVDKQNQTIQSLTERTTILEGDYTNIQEEFNNYAPIDSIDTLTEQVTQLQTTTYTKTQIQQIANGTGVDGVKVTAVVSTEATFDKDGMHYAKTGAPTTSTINQAGFEVDDSQNSKELFYAGYDEDETSSTYQTSVVRTENINVKTYLQFGNNKGRFEEFTTPTGDIGVGLFLM